MKRHIVMSAVMLTAVGCAFDVEPEPVKPVDDDTEQSLDVVAASPALPVTGGQYGFLPVAPHAPTDPSKPTPDPWNGVSPTKPTPDPWQPDDSAEENGAEESADVCGTDTQAAALPSMAK
jgi:hypothetical protein